MMTVTELESIINALVEANTALSKENAELKAKEIRLPKEVFIRRIDMGEDRKFDKLLLESTGGRQ